MRRLATRIALILGAAVLAGCLASDSTGGSPTTSGSPTIDEDKVEASISDLMTQQHPDIPVNSVTCPDGIKPDRGTTFECTAQLEGAQVPVNVTITKAEVDTGNVSYRIQPTKTVMRLEGVVEAMKAALRDQGVPNAKVDCGTGRYRVVEIRGAIKCTVSAGGKRRVVRVVDDGDDRVHFEEG